MSKTVYDQVEDAIRRKLHLGGPAKAMSVYGMHWHYPVGIELGNIVMRDSDCGLAKPTWAITTDEWSKRVDSYGLWRKIGLWKFVLADDPAASDIEFCHQNPHGAGRELFRLKQRVDEARNA